MSQGGAEWRGGLERWLNGVWYEGEIRDVDFQALGWVGRTPEARALRQANS